MRIAIPTDDRVTLCGHAGRTHGFLVFDIQDDRAAEIEYRTHTPRHGNGHHHEHAHDHEQSHQHNHSHHGLLSLLHDCELVVASGMGPRLVNDLQANGIEVRFTRLNSIEEITRALAAGTLENDSGGSHCRHHHSHSS